MEPEVTVSWRRRNLRTGARGNGGDPGKPRPLCLVGGALRGVKEYQTLSWRERVSVQSPRYLQRQRSFAGGTPVCPSSHGCRVTCMN